MSASQTKKKLEARKAVKKRQNVHSEKAPRPKSQEEKLLPDSIRKLLPHFDDVEIARGDKAFVKFFLPGSAWTWYGFGFDGVDEFFGVVDGECREIGFFSLSWLASICTPFVVERQTNFTPAQLSALPAFDE
jgi:hypothetical protein